MAYTDSTTVAAARTTAESLLFELQQIQTDYQVAKLHGETMQARVANLTDAELAAFANLLTSSHYVLLANTLAGHIYNLKQMAADIGVILSKADTNTIPDSGPVSPDSDLTAILAAQGRQLVLTDGVYSVSPTP
jgi:hypothetical protein